MDENNLNFENTSTQEEPVAPAAPEVPVTEEKNFAVTENNSWDKHQGSFGHTQELANGHFSALQNPAPQPIPGRPMPGQPMPGPVPMPGQLMNNATGVPIPPAPPAAPQGPTPMGPNPNMQGNIPPQPVYPNPNYIQTPPDPNAEMSVKDWFLALLVGYIPIAGLIVRIIWAAEQNPIPRNRPRKNWAIASLIWVAISYILTMLFSYLFVTVIRVILDYFW
jgi:hypothetical protein